MCADQREFELLPLLRNSRKHGHYRISSRNEPSSVSALQCEPLDGKVTSARQNELGRTVRHRALQEGSISAHPSSPAVEYQSAENVALAGPVRALPRIVLT